MRALILAGGDQPDPTLLDARWSGWREVALVIAADGGARYAAPLGLPLHQVVGDFDSLSASDADELEAAGVTVTRFSANKDATDTELALLAALDAGATEIALLCTWGGRSDHAIGTQPHASEFQAQPFGRGLAPGAEKDRVENLCRSIGKMQHTLRAARFNADRADTGMAGNALCNQGFGSGAARVGRRCRCRCRARPPRS